MVFRTSTGANEGMKNGSLKDIGEKVQEFVLINGKCMVYGHKFKLIRAGVVSNKYKCTRPSCNVVRHDSNV